MLRVFLYSRKLLWRVKLNIIIFQERDANHEKLQQMFEENAELALLSRSQLNNTLHDTDHLDEDTDTGNKYF